MNPTKPSPPRFRSILPPLIALAFVAGGIYKLRPPSLDSRLPRLWPETRSQEIGRLTGETESLRKEIAKDKAVILKLGEQLDRARARGHSAATLERLREPIREARDRIGENWAEITRREQRIALLTAEEEALLAQDPGVSAPVQVSPPPPTPMTPPPHDMSTVAIVPPAPSPAPPPPIQPLPPPGLTRREVDEFYRSHPGLVPAPYDMLQMAPDDPSDAPPPRGNVLLRYGSDVIRIAQR